MGLTTKEIETAKPNGKPYKLVDGGGLCLLIAPSGAKLWRWRYRFDGKEKMMALGEYPLVTLKEARDRHLVARKTLDAGIDPMAERKAEAESKQREAESSFEVLLSCKEERGSAIERKSARPKARAKMLVASQGFIGVANKIDRQFFHSRTRTNTLR